MRSFNRLRTLVLLALFARCRRSSTLSLHQVEWRLMTQILRQFELVTNEDAHAPHEDAQHNAQDDDNPIQYEIRTN